MRQNNSGKIFRDPVHGDICLSAELVRILDTREMQRLRGIKQLGTASLVYPGAVHTRFEHSLGTCALAARLMDILDDCGASIDQETRISVSAAALIHDVGHIPFGHTIEDERRLFSRHDSPERLDSLLCASQLGDELSRQGLTRKVRDILLNKAPVPWHSEIISGTFCADLLDYLARDAFFCGLPGRYDERILRSVRIEGGHIYLDAQKDGIIREDVVSETINLLRLRYFLTERVFFHHTKTASGAMISRAVEQAIERGVSLEDLCRLTDDRLYALLETRFISDPVIRMIMDNLASRRIYKRAYVLTRRIGSQLQDDLTERYHKSTQARREAEDKLLGTLKMKPGELIIYCPARSMQLKEAEVLVKTGCDDPRTLASRELPEVNVLREKHKDLWRFYVFAAPGSAENLKKISHACEEFFGSENHLAALQSPQLYMCI